MHAMLKTAMTDEERLDIKKNRLIGIENSPKMFALAASNMILRGDGKANLHQSSCFEPTLKKAIMEPDPSRGVKRPSFFIGFLMWFMCFKNNDTSYCTNGIKKFARH
jgi:hypothetical protein